MEISLAEEHAYYFIPQISLDTARERIEKKKTSLVAGMFGNLISRPNPTEIQVVGGEPPRTLLACHRNQSHNVRPPTGVQHPHQR